MIHNIFSSLIIFFGELIIYTYSEIRIPFGILNKNKNDSAPLIDKLIQNEIYANLSFGTPSQLIQLNFKMFFMAFYLPSSIINTTNSKTMKCTTSGLLPIDFESVSEGYYCTDVIYLNNTEKNVSFLLNEEYGGDYGSIGLILPYKSRTGIYTFFQTLNSNKVINSYTWTFKYFNNISLIDMINGNNAIGEFIFGDEPHNYEKNKDLYPEENYHKVDPIAQSGYLFWELEFNEIYFTLKDGSIIFFDGSKTAEIDPESGYLIGTKGYFNEVNKTFFNKYFDENICKVEQSSNKKYEYVSCSKEKFSFNDFPKLTFVHKLLENKFNLTGNDLFVLDPKTNKYMFLIIFRSSSSTNIWEFGSPFLKKYQFVFNEDKKKMGYYVSNITDSEEKEDPQNSKKSYVIIICVLVFIIICIFGVLAFLIKKGIIQLPRKRRANELEEDILYEEKKGKADKNSDDIDNINS